MFSYLLIGFRPTTCNLMRLFYINKQLFTFCYCVIVVVVVVRLVSVVITPSNCHNDRIVAVTHDRRTDIVVALCCKSRRRFGAKTL